MDIYAENVLDHYKHPRNFGKLEKASATYKDANPLCGDEIEIQLRIENGIVKEVRFGGQGCAISQAVASMLTEEIKGKKVEDVLKLEKEDVMRWLGTELTASRVKCAVLPLMVAKAGILEMSEKK